MVKEYELKFDKKFLKKYRGDISSSDQSPIDKKILSLKTNPRRGKPLFGIYPNLYELYAGSYRIYYLVREQEVQVILIAHEHKDKQKKFLKSINKKLINEIIAGTV